MAITTMNVHELKEKMERGDILLLDVREPAEYKTECIEGSYLLPLSELCYEKLPQTTKPLVIHCNSGKRSEEACKKLLAQNPQLEIYSLKGGISEWKNVGYPILRLGGNMLPLIQQVQFTAGLLIVLGVLLGLFISTWFYILPGFIGLGLMVAGLSGWCGMAMLLAKMPWNK
ncbi:MAG: rhodanese-like domain-containing protein [Gammaproteobacteria bacterium]|nr:rhodanese-like domain-containing protein [Gammaproteobacteria bacterium]